ncbi:DNA topoisomerase IB [Streptomyces roseolus]|uniref:DNA topoisomerase IB n=1 Tax=Streptomyces roseolus TaxID=67358 RepID=UPI00364B9751
MRFRTSDPDRPGRRRVRHGRGFRFLDADGSPLGAEDEARAVALAIPPTWRDVWICPWPHGHIQAVGTDAAGRRQYLYHEEFRRRQEEAKHARVRQAARGLHRPRRAVARDLARRGLCRERVLACAVRLLDLGFFRIGGERHLRADASYGLTTLLREHVSCAGREIRLDCPAKSGRRQHHTLVDEPAYRVVRALPARRNGGPRLFASWEGGAWHDLRAEELNAYLRKNSGRKITAKDFRTWHATVLAAVALAVAQPVARESRAARAKAVRRAVHEVSGYLGNTPAVCRASYIDPLAIERFEEGVTVAPALRRLGEDGGYGHPATRGPVERAVLRLLA